MHLLAAKPGQIIDGSDAVDLGQTPGEIVVLSAADSELACLSKAYAHLPEPKPALRLANLLQLSHHLSVDSYVESIIGEAKLVVVRLLGGVRYWPYGIEQVSAECRKRGIALACLPGDDQPDPQLSDHTTLSAPIAHRLWQFLVQGGIENATQFLSYGASLIGRDMEWREPRPLLRAGLYWPGAATSSLTELRAHWQADRPVAGIVFYRALVQAGQTAPIDALIAALGERGINPLPIYAAGLKEQVAADLIASFYEEAKPDITLNCTGFALSQPGAARVTTPFDSADAPGTASGARQRHAGAMARRQAGLEPARPGHAGGAAGGRRPDHDPRHLLQGSVTLRRGDPMQHRRAAARAGPRRFRLRSGDELGEAAQDG